VVDDYHILKKVMEKYFGRRIAVRKPRERGVAAILRNANYLLQIRDWNIATW
jgi:hypothetical protein